MNTRISRFLFGTTITWAIALALLVLPMPVASAPTVIFTISVDTESDEFDNPANTTCSLREAIKSANDAVNFGGCTRVGPPPPFFSGGGKSTPDVILPDLILLPSGIYTLTLAGSGEDLDATGDLDIRYSMTINATGATPPTVTGDVGWTDRIFHVVSGTVTVNGMVIHGGKIVTDYGGGIRNDGTLTLNNVTLSGNSAAGGGGIINLGTLMLNNVTLSGNSARIGGGIFNDNLGAATLTNVILSNNSAFSDPSCLPCIPRGGGIFIYSGLVTINNTVIYSNTTQGSGNSTALGGGGIFIAKLGRATLNNVTLSGNSASGFFIAGGGIHNNGGTASLTNMTLSGNSVPSGGGGIFYSGTAMLTNTIVANSPSGGNCFPSLGGNSNLSNDNTCGFGMDRDNVNVMLGPLANNGGPTLTHLPLPGSPAIDFGTNTGCPSTDQRGLPRPVNGTCDVGAVERQLFDFPFLYLPLILKRHAMNLFKKSPPIDTTQVLIALARVVHPEQRRDIVALKMVKDLVVENGKVSFTILLDEVGTPIRAPIERQVRASLAGVPGVREVKINWEARNVPRPQLTDKIENLQVKYAIAVASGKGGVGKSTVAVNLACALAKDGAKVGLLDADVHGPNIPLMMGIHEQPFAFGEHIIPLIAHNVKLMSMGFLVPAEVPVIWRGPMLSQALRQFLMDVVWGDLDFLLVDLPPGTGDVQLSLVQSITLAGALLVTTPQEVALADVVKGLEMFRQLNVPIIGVIENMSYYICPDCGHRHHIFDHGGGQRIAQKLEVPFLGEIPIDENTRAGGDTGKPVVIAKPDSPAAKAFFAMADKVNARVGQGGEPR